MIKKSVLYHSTSHRKILSPRTWHLRNLLVSVNTSKNTKREKQNKKNLSKQQKNRKSNYTFQTASAQAKKKIFMGFNKAFFFLDFILKYFTFYWNLGAAITTFTIIATQTSLELWEMSFQKTTTIVINLNLCYFIFGTIIDILNGRRTKDSSNKFITIPNDIFFVFHHVMIY